MAKLKDVKEGDVAEFSPASSALAYEIATKIGACNGGAWTRLSVSLRQSGFLMLLSTVSGCVRSCHFVPKISMEAVVVL